MKTRYLKDNTGKVIAKEEEIGNKIWLKSADLKTLGHYNISENRTYDSSLRFIGQGNLLGRLIKG